MGLLLSVNLGTATTSEFTSVGVTGIGKQPVDRPVMVRAPGPKGTAGSGLVGDDVCNLRHHGGDDQAVYAYSREDLDTWSAELGKPLPHGHFGENLTTSGLDLAATPLGTVWQVGATVRLQVTAPRIPCRTFAGHLDQPRWVRRFTERGLTGCYLRVLTEGTIAAGDPVEVVDQPDHHVTVLDTFRGLTTERQLLARVATVPTIGPELRVIALSRSGFRLDDDPTADGGTELESP